PPECLKDFLAALPRYLARVGPVARRFFRRVLLLLGFHPLFPHSGLRFSAGTPSSAFSALAEAGPASPDRFRSCCPAAASASAAPAQQPHRRLPLPRRARSSVRSAGAAATAARRQSRSGPASRRRTPK